MRPHLAACVLLLSVQCARVRSDPPPVDAAPERSAPAPVAPAVPVVVEVTSVHFSQSSPEGGQEVTCAPDGTLEGQLFNRGFSPGGGEIVPLDRVLAPARAAELVAVAKSLAASSPGRHEAADAGWTTRDTLVVALSNGTDVTLAWPGDAPHPDPRVQRVLHLLFERD